MEKELAITIPLPDVGMEDIHLVGGKSASLGEMIRKLTSLGVVIPNGFAITTKAYYLFIEESGLSDFIRQEMENIDFDEVESLRRAGLRIRQAISNVRFPVGLSEQIVAAYRLLSSGYQQEYTDVAVRSSATAEDLPDASFAGQQESYLNVRGPAALMDAVRNCFASLFTDRAISYRRHFDFDFLQVGLSVCVQKMVRSDLGASGVAFSLDTESGFPDVVLINGAYGLGELVVQGAISPDEFLVFKPTRRKGFESIIEKKPGLKDKMMVCGDDSDERTKVISVERPRQKKLCLSDEKVLELADWVMKIEHYYSEKKGSWCPMDVEWALDGLSGQLFIVQARPETIHSRKKRGVLKEYELEGELPVPLLTGVAVGDKIGSGQVHVMHSLDNRIGKAPFLPGQVLVTDMTDPDWEPIMKQASAIVTNKGGRTCHAAIVARELGVPAIVGCGNATELLEDGMEITASCVEGSEGKVYMGRISFSSRETDLTRLPALRTPLMLNLGNPELAFSTAALPHSGVGLAREEFIIANAIKAHPLALLYHESLGDASLTDRLLKLTEGYASAADYFVQKLSFGIAKIAAAFYPKPVIVRFSDFKSNEYRGLMGGEYFEPKEENPMIGWRGASRYYSDAYKMAFGLECAAIKNVREYLGLNNVIVMVPFCRTVEELRKVYAVMAENGLQRGEEGLQVYLMAELPSNILLAEQFAEHIDGFSIGSNDLTQLTLGLDRDSSLVAHLYDERNEAVKILIRQLIRVAKKTGVKAGICGQAPSDHPEFAAFLVNEGIDSVSVTPDAIVRTVFAMAKAEGEG